MALYAVVKRNPYWRPGSFVESFDDGVQKVRFVRENNRLRIIGHEGLILPMNEVRPFLMRVLTRGLDK